MPAKTPETTQPAPGSLPVKAATFIAAVEVPGHGVLSSVNVERHKDLFLRLTDLGLDIECPLARRVIVPFTNLKAAYL